MCCYQLGANSFSIMTNNNLKILSLGVDGTILKPGVSFCVILIPLYLHILKKEF